MHSHHVLKTYLFRNKKLSVMSKNIKSEYFRPHKTISCNKFSTTLRITHIKLTNINPEFLKIRNKYFENIIFLIVHRNQKFSSRIPSCILLFFSTRSLDLLRLFYIYMNILIYFVLFLISELVNYTIQQMFVVHYLKKN